MKPYNADLVHQVIRIKLLNKRRPIASTKDRAQVAGGGKKPWPQKGTGRARAGSRRSPLWRGGGVTFGPTRERNYQGIVTPAMAKGAFAMVLAKKKEDKELIAVDAITLAAPKTKAFSQWLRSVVAKGSALVVPYEDVATIKRAGRNMASVKVCDQQNVDILDVVTYNYLIIAKEALTKLGERLAKK